jgi:hypothetical protein
MAFAACRFSCRGRNSTAWNIRQFKNLDLTLTSCSRHATRIAPAAPPIAPSRRRGVRHPVAHQRLARSKPET